MNSLKKKIKFFSKEFFLKKNKKKLLNKVNKVLSSGIFTNGIETKKFEEKFAKFNKIKYCLALNSGTSALHLALKSIEIKQNDEVIIPATTFIATPAAVVYCNAKPVFVDINKNNWLIDLDQIEAKITKKTKAIIVVHLHGLMLDMIKLSRIAKKYNLKIIEDASQAHGSTFLKKFPGFYSDIATFSFYPTKTLGSFGEGGAIITKNNKLYNKIYSMRDWSKKNNDFLNIGYNYRMPEITATLLIESLKVLNQDLRKRNIIAKRYTSKLSKNIKFCSYNNKKHFHSYYVFSILVQQRQKLIKYLKKEKSNKYNLS